MDVDAVCEGIARVARTIPDLAAYPSVPDSIVEPAFVVYTPDPIDFTGANARGCDEMIIVCLVCVSKTDDVAGQKLLRSYMNGSGPTSLKETLEGPDATQNLGGACDDLFVQRWQNPRIYKFGETPYYGAQIVVKVIGPG